MKSKDMRYDEEKYPGIGRYKYLFTILVITFNRANLIERAIKSVLTQGIKGLEILIIDDGSADDTSEVIRKIKTESDLPIKYIWQENQGKPAAYNKALGAISGYFTMVLDSDDILAPNILPRMDQWWNTISIEKRPLFAGIEGLCAELRTKEIMGDAFPYSPMDSNFLETRYCFNISGDKRHIIRTDVMRQYPFPLFKGERHMRESVIWCRMALRYQFRYVNEVVQYCEQLPDGLSAHPRERWLQSPNNFRLAFLELLNLYDAYLTKKNRYWAMVRYVRHSLVAGIPLQVQLSDLRPKNRLLWFLALPEGLISATRDRFSIKFKGGSI